MKDKINCGSACVNYILNQLKLPIKDVQNDMVWTSELAVSLKNNGINNLEVLFFNSSLYNGYKTDYKRDFIGFNLLDDLIGHNIKLSERRLTVKELEKEIINNKYIILCVESKKFNKDKKMTGGHFIVINSLENNLPFSVFIDEEGLENILCAYYHGVFIITMIDDNIEYKKIDMDFNIFRVKIIKDIEKYFNDWVVWNMENDPKILKSREIELRNKLSIAKEKLKKYR